MQFKYELDTYQKHTKQILQKFETFKLKVNKSIRVLEDKINEILQIVFPQKYVIDTLINTIDSDNFEEFEDLVKTCRLVESSEIIVKLQKKLDFKFAKWNDALDKLLILDKSIIPKAGQLILKFDDQARFPSIEIKQDGLAIFQTQSTNHYAIACLDYSYDNFGEEQTMQYKMLNAIGDVGVGVCEFETLQEKQFRPRLSDLGSGTFICFQDRYTVHTTNKQDNWITKGFRYQTGDIIQVKFIPQFKTITWTKLQNGESHTLHIDDMDKEFRPCVVVKSQGCSVELLNDLQ